MHRQQFTSNNFNYFQNPYLTCYPFIRKLSNLSKFHFNNFLSKLLWKDPLLNLLEAGDSIMADKGFDIDDLLKPIGVTLDMPPKRDSNRQLARKEVEQRR